MYEFISRISSSGSCFGEVLVWVAMGGGGVAVSGGCQDEDGSHTEGLGLKRSQARAGGWMRWLYWSFQP